VNATETYVPPLIVFPRIKVKQELMDGAPADSISACRPSGCIQTDIHVFTEWFGHFVHYVKPSADDPVLLIGDGHYSHARNLDVVEKAREHSVAIVSLPPHSTHKMLFSLLLHSVFRHLSLIVVLGVGVGVGVSQNVYSDALRLACMLSVIFFITLSLHVRCTHTYCVTMQLTVAG
jgi:hypothetical protein